MVEGIIRAVDLSARAARLLMVHLVNFVVIRADLERRALVNGTRRRQSLLRVSRPTGIVRVVQKDAVDAYAGADATGASAGKGCMLRRTETGCRGHEWSGAGAVSV